MNARKLRQELLRKARANYDWREWDFLKVPERELLACHTWEFCRSNTQTELAVAEWRKRGWNPRIDEIDMNDPGLVLGLPFPALCLLPNFPRLPYQALPNDERKQIAASLDDPNPELRLTMNFRKLFDVYPEAVDEYGAICEGHLTVAAFQIDWNESDKGIVRRFAEWLRKNRPKAQPIHETRGAGAPVRALRAELKALGALRLLKQMPWEDAFVLTKERLGRRGLFSAHALAWKRAKADAGRILRANG